MSGWNNIVTGATFRTVGLTGAWSPTPKLYWTNTYYGGPDENKADRGERRLYDTVLLLSPGARASFHLNFDYFHNSPRHTPGYQVYGVAGAAKFQPTKKLSLNPRLEWLSDGTGMATGTSRRLKEFTVTGSYALADRLSGWVEFRNDWSNRPLFPRGARRRTAGNSPPFFWAW